MRVVEILRQTAVLSAFAGACLGQSAPATAVRAGQFAAGAPSVWFSTAPGMMIGQQDTAGIPFSAEMVSEHQQMLADGTNITETHVQSKIYHDSQGRTRTELFLQFPGRTAELPSFIQISDPVAGYRYTLDPQRHTVQKMAFRVASGTSNRVISANSTAVPAKMAPVIADPLTGHSPAKQAGVIAAFIGPPSAGNSPDSAPRPEISQESLGTQNIEGVQATGRRMTTIYPEGFFGNDRPMKTTYESWTSPELRMTVLTISSDPRYGDTTMRMTNIVLAEPDASLFEIPSDYQESNGGAMGGGISFDPRPAVVK